MAKYQVDRDSEYMRENWGTTKLVTDYGAMTPTTKEKKNDPPNDRMSRPCGGKGGFDDYVERWHWISDRGGINITINRLFYADQQAL